MLLSTANFRLKNVPAKLQGSFVGPFLVVDRISHLVYKLKLPEQWKIHNAFHVSLLRHWRESLYSVAQHQAIPRLQPPEDVQ